MKITRKVINFIKTNQTGGNRIAIVTSIIKEKIRQWWGKQGMVWSNNNENKIPLQTVLQNWTDDYSRQFITYILSDESGVNQNQYLKGKTEDQIYEFFEINKDNMGDAYYMGGPIVWFDDGILFIQRIYSKNN